MPQPLEERQDRFKRLFPSRVETLIKTLQLLGNCTNKQKYAFNEDLAKRAWIEIAKHFEETAELYGLKFEVSVNGTPAIQIDTSEPYEV